MASGPVRWMRRFWLAASTGALTTLPEPSARARVVPTARPSFQAIRAMLAGTRMRPNSMATRAPPMFWNQLVLVTSV